MRIIAESQDPLGLIKIKQLSGLHPTRVTVVMSELAEQGFLRKESRDGKQVYLLVKHSSAPDLSRYVNQNKVKTAGLEAMLAYAETSSLCRMKTLCHALGDSDDVHCDHCDACKPSPHKIPQDASHAIESWVNARVVKIESSKIPVLSEGIAILDGKQRSALFSDFMRRRALSKQPDAGIAEKLQALILSQMAAVIKNNQIRSIIMAPSTTWQSREAVGHWLGLVE